MTKIDIRRIAHGCEVFRDEEFLGSVERRSRPTFDVESSEKLVRDLTTFDAAVQWLEHPEKGLPETGEPAPEEEAPASPPCRPSRP